MKYAIVALVILMLGIKILADDIRRTPAEKREIVISLEFVIDQDSEILVGSKRIKMDAIPDNGRVTDVAIDGNRIKRIVYEEPDKPE